MKTGIGQQGLGRDFAKSKISALIAQHSVLFFALCAMLLALCSPATAQQPKRIVRIAVLTAAPASSPSIEAFRQRMQELGYTDGKDVSIEIATSQGRSDRFADLAADLARRNVDVILAGTDIAVRSAKNATKTIPIVMAGVGTDPVDSVLVETLARPGGNITGLTNLAGETAAKRLELFKETFPKAIRIAVLFDPAVRGNVLQAKDAESIARHLGLTVQTREVKNAESFDGIFTTLSKERPDGLYVPGGPVITANDKRVIDFAIQKRIPTVYHRKDAVLLGGLMSYGADNVEQYRRAAYFVDKILKGAKPADMPVERPTRFELVINLKTAKQIGVTIPPNVLARADRVIR
jgi:putative tryptophan/tyrosine transport system substrate-binding protein